MIEEELALKRGLNSRVMSDAVKGAHGVAVGGVVQFQSPCREVQGRRHPVQARGCGCKVCPALTRVLVEGRTVI